MPKASLRDILFLPLALIDHHTARVPERNALDLNSQQPGELRATPLSYFADAAVHGA